METQKYTVPVTRTNTRMIPVTKKVPKTIYVDVTENVPQNYTITTMQTRERQVAVPYYVNVPETKYRTVTEQVPIEKSKVQMDTVTKTVYDTQVKTRCTPETKMVSKQIPVYNVIARPAPPCPPGADCGGNIKEDFSRIDKDGDGKLNYNEVAFDIADQNKDGVLSHGPAPPCPPGADCGGNITEDFSRIDKDGDGMLNYNKVAFDIADQNKDGVLSHGEYFNARATGNLSNTAGFGNVSYSLDSSNVCGPCSQVDSKLR